MRINFIFRIVLLFCFVTINYFLGAMSRPPQSMSKLIESSQFIIAGKVIDIKENPSGKSYERYIAYVLVDEYLKDSPSINDDTIKVYFAGKTMCPRQAYYELNTTVVSFLSKSETPNIFINRKGVYGLKTGSKRALRIYRKRVFEMLNILYIADDRERARRITDWSIECLKNKYLQTEGILELVKERKYLYNYDETLYKYSLIYPLSEPQKSKLRRLYFSSKNRYFYNVDYIDIIINEDDKEMISFLVKKIKQSNIKDSFYWTKYGDLLNVVANITEREDLLEISKEISKNIWASSDDEMIVYYKKYIEAL